MISDSDTITLPLPVGQASLLPVKLQWALIGRYRADEAFADAAALLDEIEARSGRTSRLLEERARLAFAAGDLDAAHRLLQERIEHYPSATAWIALARFHLETGDVATPAAISADLTLSDPGLLTVATLAADVARATGDVATFRGYHERLLEERPEHLSPLLALARLAVDEADLPTAMALLRRIRGVLGETATPAQLTAFAEIAAAVDEPGIAEEFRACATRAEATRTDNLMLALQAALHGGPSDARFGAAPADSRRREAAARSEPPTGRDAPSPEPVDAGHGAGPKDDAIDTPSLPEIALDHSDERVRATLERDFGYDTLRPGQGAVIANVLARRDTLAIMPTGAGKSLSFQLPAMLLDGTTLVISPLIALMKDQVESLPLAVRERTTLINSTLAPAELRQRLDKLAAGDYKLVYAAPERLRQHAFLRALREAGTALVVIDEAHCISLWGHDFRPDYLSIPRALPELGDPSILAVTATATPLMARAIAAGLNRQLDRVQVSLFRPNLFYEVYRLANREEKVTKAIEVSRRERGHGIIYVSSRKDADVLAALLRDRGVTAISYHAGLDPDTRAQHQERFMSGRSRVIVATVAFGMGVNKADVRFIIHLSPPRSLEAYAQESGRAGRDGRPARCVLLTAPSDQATLNRLARRDETDLSALRRVYAGLQRAASGRWVIADPNSLLPSVGSEGDGDDPDPRIALGLLEQAHFIRRLPDTPVTLTVRRHHESTAPHGADGTDASRETWTRFSPWAGLNGDARQGRTVRTAEAADAIGLAPPDLVAALAAEPDVLVLEGPREVCLELLPVHDNATAILTDLLARAGKAARDRIAQVMAYAQGGSCRHVMLAAQFGERLDPCLTACDVCANPDGAAPVARSARNRATRSETTAADARAVLNGVRHLSFSMGKTGWLKLLAGSVESRVRADRSAAFGALAGVPRGRIDALIDRLVDEGFLHRDLDHEFKILRLTPLGASATDQDLAGYDRPEPRSSMGSPPRGRTPDPDTSLDAEGNVLLDRLRAWRRQRATADAVPPYVVAHDSMLHDLALAQPTTHAELAQVKGFGPSRIEKYGEELLVLLTEH